MSLITVKQRVAVIKSMAFFLLILTISCQQKTTTDELPANDPYELVNPFIGTGGHGHTYPGATMPFGMVQLSPDTRLTGWDGCSGYHYTDSIIYGFSHTHLSGTGVSDYGDVLLMPFTSEKDYTHDEVMSKQHIPSKFLKTTEKAKPGYYAVELEDDQISVQLTSTTRVGIHRYHFKKTASAKVLLDLHHRDELLDYEITIENDTTISGKRISKAWATEQHVYFVMQTSVPFHALIPAGNDAENSFFRILNFVNNPSEVIIKVGISAVSVEGAKANLQSEAAHWDFDTYKQEAKDTWSAALSKIQAKSLDQEKLVIFYSALYHTMIAPNVFSDVTGEYRGMDKSIHQTDKGEVYTIFSLWDTFRGTHPLYTIIEQEKTNEFIRTFLKHYEEGGRLPVWELAGNETDCMIGYHSVSVIADAYLKGLRDYDAALALEAMQHSAQLDHLGLKDYREKGFIASGDEAESVSKTLEYAYDDWCIAQMAKEMGNTAVYDEYIQRGQYYKNIFNPEVGFMQAKLNGAWTTGFDPAEVNFNFTEANSWQYSMFAIQDIEGMIELYGGAAAFEEKLDQLFETEMELSGRHQVDITGLIGQYAHGNEPSHHMAYLYNYIGKPWKSQERIHQILTEQYSTAPDGLSGNEDCGQMSAWYVLSSMGFYSVTPGLSYYTIGKPHLEEVNLQLESGKQFKIRAQNLSEQNRYIQQVTLNGKPYSKSFITHEDIMNGGEMVIKMGQSPNKEWGSSKGDIPASRIHHKDQIVPVPYFSAASQSFTDSLTIKLSSACLDCEIYYQLAGDKAYAKYELPITIKKDTKIHAYAIRDNQRSKTVEATYKKVKGGRSIQLMSEYSNQYSAGGNNALIDHLYGGKNFRTGYWQGYRADFKGVIDLGSIEEINKIELSALQDIKSWIFFPTQVKISVSDNPHSFKELATIKNDFPDNRYGAFTKRFSYKSKPINVRYIKVEAQNYGVCPDWHLGKGGKTWLFMDEIIIE
ncbi:MAG: GH92 family glycosyl hydrolase [Flammeovirgaceae bacterium]